MLRWLTRLTLGAAGVIAIGVGGTIALDPHMFYAGYGIEPIANPDLMSELRAPGVNLAALGALILTGAVRLSMARLAATLGATVFLAYGAGRLLSLLFDGAPSGGIVAAMAIELVIGAACAGLLIGPAIRAPARARPIARSA